MQTAKELKAQNEEPQDPQEAAMRQKVVGALKNDPKMRVLRWPWTRIAVRVVGSWIVASGLLMIGWRLRGKL